jgi:hypothetical protein
MIENKEWFASLAGQTLNGKYILDRYIGSGYIGVVYQGHHKDMSDWNLAIKLTTSVESGWENEVQKPQKLTTVPGVVPFHDIGADHIKHNNQTKIVLFTVWDYIHPGRNLKDYLKTVETCPASFLVAVLEQILRVLHACQIKGVKRHGDLHPGNILIGDKDEANLDANLNARESIFVSDFGYGTTGGHKTPKDDYKGLAAIAEAIIQKIEWDKATPTDRQIITKISSLMNKLLKEESNSERVAPKEILKSILDVDRQTRASGGFQANINKSLGDSGYRNDDSNLKMSVGQFQVSEMLGDNWDRWNNLFVSSVPAKSRILEPDVPTVITGPRGCGKTMLLRRLSERLIVECGSIEESPNTSNFTAFYVNSNDIADAFSSFEKKGNNEINERLICYANLAILSDLLAVQSARAAKYDEVPTEDLLNNIKKWLVNDQSQSLVTGQNELEHYRSILEQIKWKFPQVDKGPYFPGYNDFSQHSWLPRLISMARQFCPWINSKTVFIFIDDYTTPRISIQMQKVLNRLFFQRSSEFVCKVATESATTFIPLDSSNKVLQDGDDFQLIDMGEESLFMEDSERAKFLNEIFSRRLSLDPRISDAGHTLEGLLGHINVGKLEFARLLRQRSDKENTIKETTPVKSQRRGVTRAKALYHGCEVFTDLWSGDTRTIIQLVQELVDASTPTGQATRVPVETETQDRVLRNRGGQWLGAQSRNQPTDRTAFRKGVKALQQIDPTFEITESGYGNHLKAVVESFAKIARQLLLSPMYKLENRYVPRMAFRIEVTDEFRVDGLAEEIYKDLIRYGMFMRDARGKSVRGAFVPRLYLRRLLLPYATLALSKRDSVQMNCDWFKKLLLTPDKFNAEFTRYVKDKTSKNPEQTSFNFEETDTFQYNSDPRYDDIKPEDDIRSEDDTESNDDTESEEG